MAITQSSATFALVAMAMLLLAPAHAGAQVIDFRDVARPGARDEELDAPAELPSPESVIDRFIEATGGRNAWERIRNRRTIGTFSQNGSAPATITIRQAPPNLRHVTVARPGGNVLRYISNADESWTYDGENVVASSGDQRRQEIRRAAFDMLLHWDGNYELSKTLGVRDVGGRPAVVVRLTAEDCHKLDLFFDEETGRLVRTVQDIAYAGEAIQAEANFSGYRSFDGIELPTRTHRVLLYRGSRTVQEYTVTSVEHDVEMDAGLFATPVELGGADT